MDFPNPSSFNNLSVQLKLVSVNPLAVFYLTETKDGPFSKIMTSPNQRHITKKIKGPVIIYRLAGAEDFGGFLVFRKIKGGINENFGRIQRRVHTNLLGK